MLRKENMKNAIKFKDVWLMKNSTAYQLFTDWKAQKDPVLAKTYRKKFDDHMKVVNGNYEKIFQD